MRKFHRERGDRRHFLRSLIHNLILKERMTTTVARAKEARPALEKLVSAGKKGTLAAYRRLLQKLPKQSAAKLYYDIAPRYKERKGGYLRITKLTRARKRDAAPQAVIEFI